MEEFSLDLRERKKKKKKDEGSFSWLQVVGMKWRRKELVSALYIKWGVGPTTT